MMVRALCADGHTLGMVVMPLVILPALANNLAELLIAPGYLGIYQRLVQPGHKGTTLIR